MRKDPSNSSTSMHSISLEPNKSPDWAEELEVREEAAEEAAAEVSEPDDEEESPFALGFEDENNKGFAIAESQAVWRGRLVVLMVLLASTIGVSTAVHRYLHRSEQRAFEEHFADNSSKMLCAIGSSLHTTLEALNALAVNLVAHAEATDQQWPFVTVSNFGLRASQALMLSKMKMLACLPVVTPENRLAWEKYSLEFGKTWVDQDQALMETDPNYFGPIYYDYEEYGVIHGDFDDVPYNATRDMLPTWQNYPVYTSEWSAPYNYDYMSVVFPESMEIVLEKGNAVVSDAYLLPDPNDEVSVAETVVWIEWLSDYVQPNEDPSEPVSDFYTPFFDETSSVGTPRDRKPVGMLTGTLFWRDAIKDVLPPNSGNVLVVFTNPCNPSFTYQVSGPNVTYLGRGDLHETKFDDFVESRLIFDMTIHDQQRSQYTGPPLDDEFCPFAFHVYPSTQMQDKFITNQAVVCTAIAVAIFVFTSLVFLVYDRCVDKRQRKIVYAALHSAANVSLLEEKVKQRTSKLEVSNKCLEEANERIRESSAAQLEHFACMSHEIRTPLNCIIGMSSYLQELDLRPVEKDSVSMIVNSGRLLSTVVDDVLDYSSLESGNVEITMRQISLQETLNSVVGLISTKCDQQNLRLDAFLDASIGDSFHTDNRRLQQILYNLLGNAVKFAERGSTVELGLALCCPKVDGFPAESYSPKEVTITGTALRITVKDYGKGIARRDFAKIFGAFRQASEQSEEHYGGTGLGLSIATKLVHRMGGNISVASQEGEGAWTQFAVDLPYIEATVDRQEIASRFTGTSFVVVEDDLAIAKRIENIFKAFRISPRLVQSGEMMSSFLQSSECTTARRVVVVSERLYTADVAAAIKDDDSLVTYGTKYVADKANLHFRSILHTLPSVVMKRLSDALSKAENSTQNRSQHVRETIWAASGLRVLIAEDNAVNRKVLTRILSRLGVTHIDTAENGQIAVDMEASQPYDIVFMDAQMPVMDGADACRFISHRSTDGKHAIPKIVFVTAQVSSAFKEECLDAGAFSFIPKPCTVDSVGQCLQEISACTGNVAPNVMTAHT